MVDLTALALGEHRIRAVFHDMTATDFDGEYLHFDGSFHGLEQHDGNNTSNVGTGMDGFFMDHEHEQHSESHINMVNHTDTTWNSTGNEQIILDSGADFSVAPAWMSVFGRSVDVGRPYLRDAQGRQIPVPEVRELRLLLQDESGTPVILKENFAIAHIAAPLLAAGNLTKAGWSILAGEDGPCLSRGSLSIPLQYARNSLSVRGRVYQVIADGEINAIDIGKGVELRGEWKSYLDKPGWHILADGSPLLVAHCTRRFQNPTHMFVHQHWPARLTLADVGEGKWQVCENVADYMDQEDPFKIIPNLPGEGARQYRTTLTFLGAVQFDEKFLTGAEPVGQEALRAEPAHPAVDLAGAIPVEVPVAVDEKPKVVVNGVSLDEDSTNKQMRDACKFLELPISGDKGRLWKRLVAYFMQKEHEAALEAAKVLYREAERVPEARPFAKEPTVEQRALHSLTHTPKADWCDACVSCRSREDNHGERVTDEPKQRLVFQLDYMFMSDDNSTKQKAGCLTCLVMAESQFGSILAIPCKQKGAKSLKYCVEEIVRHTMLFQDQRPIFRSDGEPATRQLLRAIQTCRSKLGLATEVDIANSKQANGAAERAVRTLRCGALTLMHQLETNYQMRLPVTHRLTAWALRHWSWLHNRYHVPQHRALKQTAYEAMCGQQYRNGICVFGEVVIAKPEHYHKNQSWKPCVWVGRSTSSDRNIVLDGGGAHEVRTVRRIPICWRPEVLQLARGMPYDNKDSAIKTTYIGAQPVRIAEAEQDAIGDEAASDPESVDEPGVDKVGDEVAIGLALAVKPEGKQPIVPGRVPPPASAAVASNAGPQEIQSLALHSCIRQCLRHL